jgi:hypothetical protein
MQQKLSSFGFQKKVITKRCVDSVVVPDFEAEQTFEEFMVGPTGGNPAFIAFADSSIYRAQQTAVKKQKIDSGVSGRPIVQKGAPSCKYFHS